MSETFIFNVGTTDRRPIVPEQYISRVAVQAETLAQAIVLAAGMAHRPASPEHSRAGVVMVTSTTLVRVEI